MAERPLIILLDDRADARETMRELFESIGCTVIPVATYESAFEEISRENIDFVVTDLNLKADQNDKSGVMFAKMARKVRGDLLIAAYSAKVKELKLTPSDYRVFDVFLDKGSANSAETLQFVNECKALAIAHKEMSKKLPGSITRPTDARLQELEGRLNAVETSYFRIPDLRPYARATYTGLGLLGAIASIIGLYYVLR
jgi:CheY-like chemotaxis protein